MTGPLEGLRVLDLSRILAGPYCTMILGDLGADVIKVERPGTGDDTRAWGPPFAGGESTYYLSANRNKRSLTLNLRAARGVATLKALAAKSDILVENFPPGTMERLGIGYDTLAEINPRLIFASITGFGPDGPSRDRPGYDMVVSAIGGLMGITGDEDGAPVKVGVAITDVLTGVTAYGAILTALWARERTGRGQRIDLSLLECQVAALVNIASSHIVAGTTPKRWGSAHESIVPYQAFQAQDRWFAIAVGNDEQWLRFADAIGRPDLKERAEYRTNALRVKNRKALVAMLQEIFAARPAAEWVRRIGEADVTVGLVQSVEEVFRDPQVLHRGMLAEVPHPTIGKLRMVGIPVKYSDTPAAIRRPPPLLGQHTEEILREVLAYGPREIDELRKEKAI